MRACVRACVRGRATCTCYGGVVWVWPQSGRSVRTYVTLRYRTGPDRTGSAVLEANLNLTLPVGRQTDLLGDVRPDVVGT